MTGTYAAGTDVPAERSKAEIERTLMRYGADEFMYGTSRDGAVVQFRADGRMVRFVLPMPDRASHEFTRTATGKAKTEAAAQKAWEQATRQRWRALLLAIKAKLEAVQIGLATFEQEFLAYVVLPGGDTVGTWLAPQLDHAYSTGAMPTMLPALGAGPSTPGR